MRQANQQPTSRGHENTRPSVWEQSSRKTLPGIMDSSTTVPFRKKRPFSRPPSLAEDPTFRIGRSSDFRAGANPAFSLFSEKSHFPVEKQWPQNRGGCPSYTRSQRRGRPGFYRSSLFVGASSRSRRPPMRQSISEFSKSSK
jgi:hypothetical protein